MYLLVSDNPVWRLHLEIIKNTFNFFNYLGLNVIFKKYLLKQEADDKLQVLAEIHFPLELVP